MQRIGYRAAVNRQPGSLQDCLNAVVGFAAAGDLEPFRGGMLALVGIGASYQVALAGARYLRKLGIPAHPFYPSELDGQALAQHRAVILLSASGESAELLDAAALCAALPRLAICRSAENPLAAIADLVLACDGGPDNGASSTGYTGMLLAIALLARLLARTAMPAELGSLPDTVRMILRDCDEPAYVAAERLQACRTVDLVGTEIEYATAGEGAILLREAVRLPASAWDTRNYLHGPMESQDAQAGIIAIGAGREVAIAKEMAGLGAASILITSHSVAPEAHRCIVPVPLLSDPIAQAIASIIAVQLIVGAMQDAAGLTDVRFRYPQPDTKRRATLT